MTKQSSGTQVVTFGCRLNTYESQVIKDLSSQAGLEDAIIVNTCAVTAEAERQARQSLRKLRRENPDSEIIVTGCSAQINPKQYEDMAEVSRVIGNEEKMTLEAYTNSAERVQVNDIMSIKETAGHLVTGFEGKARAFVQVQNGCNHRCTFCTIPYGRGNSRSVPIGEITNQIRTLVENGYAEIAITGVDITDYGKDLPGTPTLGQMLRRVLANVPELKRLRISSIDAVEMDDDLWRLIAEEDRVMPHLHISLQAGDDMTLKRMKRRHLRQDVVDFCKKARDLRPDIVFGADIIAGFPTETNEMFENTRQIIADCDIIYAHIFPYSARPGTPAARMPQVDRTMIKTRAGILREEGRKQLSQYLDTQVGTTQPILVEDIKDGQIIAKTDYFTPVKIKKSQEINPGSVVLVDITGHSGDHLVGELSEGNT